MFPTLLNLAIMSSSSSTRIRKCMCMEVTWACVECQVHSAPDMSGSNQPSRRSLESSSAANFAWQQGHKMLPQVKPIKEEVQVLDATLPSPSAQVRLHWSFCSSSRWFDSD